MHAIQKHENKIKTPVSFMKYICSFFFFLLFFYSFYILSYILNFQLSYIINILVHENSGAYPSHYIRIICIHSSVFSLSVHKYIHMCMSVHMCLSFNISIFLFFFGEGFYFSFSSKSNLCIITFRNQLLFIYRCF